MNPKHLATQSRIAVESVEAVDEEVKQGQPADKVLADFFRENRQYGSRDRRFIRNLVFAWFRWRGWIMHSAPGDWEKRTAVAGLLEADEMDPALEHLVGQINPPLIDPSAAGNATLEEKAALLKTWLGLDALPEVPALFPAWVPESLVDPTQLAFMQTRPTTWIRVQQQSLEKVKAICDAEKIRYQAHERLHTALAIPTAKELTQLNEKAGHLFEIQNIASQCVGWICTPEPGQTWWDACAGSGGKSLQLADMMQDDCKVTATDKRSGIMHELSRRIKKKKKTSINMRMLDVIAEEAPGTDYDGVLIDAPCSGLGMWARHSDARWRINASSFENLGNLQKTILAQGAKNVRSGGTLIYAVCTLTKAETTDIVEHFLSNHPEFTLDETSHPLTGVQTEGSVWITPEETGGDAMFVTRMKKSS